MVSCDFCFVVPTEQHGVQQCVDASLRLDTVGFSRCVYGAVGAAKNDLSRLRSLLLFYAATPRILKYQDSADLAG